MCAVGRVLTFLIVAFDVCALATFGGPPPAKVLNKAAQEPGFSVTATPSHAMVPLGGSLNIQIRVIAEAVFLYISNRKIKQTSAVDSRRFENSPAAARGNNLYRQYNIVTSTVIVNFPEA